MALISDFPPPIEEVSVIQMNDPKSPFLYDAVNSKKVDPPSIRSGEFMAKNADLAKSLSSLRDQLQEKLPGLKISITHFSNWGTTIDSLLLYVKPQSREDVCSIIANAKELSIKVGMGGAYHTWSPSYPDSGGLLINTCDILLPLASDTWTSARMRLNRECNEVTIAPGVTTGELMQFFLDHDVTFKADVVLPSVTYGGVFSGGCHGTGKTQPTMSDWITSMTIVDGNGEIKTIPGDYSSSKFTDSEILSAASASLGLFGVILDVTVKVDPMVNARVKNDFSHKLDLLREDNEAALAKILQERDSVEVFWFPFNSIFNDKLKLEDKKATLKFDEKELATGKVVRPFADWDPWKDDLWSREINFTNDRVNQDPGVPLYNKIIDLVTGGAMSIGKAIFGSMLNKLTPLTLALGFKMLKFQYGFLQEEKVVKMPWAIHYRDAIDLNYAYDMEFAFPIDISKPGILHKAVKVVVDLTHDYSKNGWFYEDTKAKGVNSYPLNLAMEFRVMHRSKALLCPASLGDQEHILYIELLSHANTPGVCSYFKEISHGWKLLGGVPHWQKQWTFLDKDGDMVTYLNEKYGSNLDKFKAIRDALKVDPNDMFVNSVYKSTFWPPKPSQ